MTIRKAKRILSLANALAARRVMHLRQAAELLGVSEMTVRRDIAGHRCGAGAFGQSRFETMRITSQNQPLQRRQRLGLVPWSLWHSSVWPRRSLS